MDVPFFNSANLISHVKRSEMTRLNREIEGWTALQGQTLDIEKLKSLTANGELLRSHLCPRSNCKTEVLKVTGHIKNNTSTADFDAFISTIPGYTLEDGNNCHMNALCAAAWAGNDALVAHIIKIGGEHLVNLGGIGHTTPLMFAGFCGDHSKGLAVAEILLAHNANIIARSSDDSSITNRGWTALHYALQYKSHALVQKLIRSGCRLQKKLDSEEKKNLDQAMRILFDRYLALRAFVPRELIMPIIDYSI